MLDLLRIAALVVVSGFVLSWLSVVLLALFTDILRGR